MKTIAGKFFTVLFLGLFVLSTVVLAQTEEEESEEENSMSELAKGPKYGLDSVECVKNVSLYREYYRMYVRDKNEAYLKDAIGSWRYVFDNCPLATQNIFIDGVVIVKYLYEREPNPELKENYIDTLMMVYDRRITYYGREGFVLGRKGADMMKYRQSDFAGVYSTFVRSFELQKEKSEAAVLYYYFIATTNYVRAGLGDTTLVLEVYDKVSSIAESNLKSGGSKSYQTALDNIEPAFTPWATCGDLIKIYTLKFNETPEDIDLLKKIISILDRKECTESELYFNAAKKLHELEPSAESALSMGRMSLSRRKISDAIGFFEQAINLFTDNDKKADALLLQADAYRQQNNFQASRSSALRAATLRPNDGTPYLIIGDLYAASVNQCGDNDFFKRTVYWVAVDKYQRARSADPSNKWVVDIANSRISQYIKQFPITADIFFNNLVVGDSYTVGCWINETTTIRAAD